ncbi:MAG: glycosyltransferase family 2 protein [Niabella sp.]
MQLSVIIVNYNVKFFLEKCLRSVQLALNEITGEVLVVDNHSSDGSLSYLQPLFPCVRFIANRENVGFGKACNQGLALASGKYILFLNPDTIVRPDSFRVCLQKFEEDEKAGAVGVKMVDGNGVFLKESKRALPGPASSLYKLFGLSALFPGSKRFSKYNLGYLDENRDHEVDVLCGAFMMIRKTILNKTGGFDEAFFMYGEDIDLSYRIQKAGFKNYYLAKTEIIHFKGESTDKKSFKYIKMFYGAMAIFVNKHYRGPKKFFLKRLIYLGIGISASIGTVQQLLKKK